MKTNTTHLKPLIPLFILLICMAGWGSAETVLNMTFNNADGIYNSTFAEDLSGYGNNGTVINAINWSSGYNGQSYYFDGDTDYIAVSQKTQFENRNNITISFWLNLNSTSQAQSPRLVHLNSVWSINFNKDDDELRFGAYQGGFTEAEANTILAPKTWYFVTCVYNGSHLAIWQNGELKGSIAKTGTLPTSASPLYIGIDEDLTNNDFWGFIDELKIYDRALSPTEIYNEYQSYQPAPQTDYYYSMSGSDSNNCSISTPCKYDYKTRVFTTGDTLYFNRGDKFVNGSFTSTSGTTITSYGIGDKPQIWGALNKSLTSDWNDEGSNIWSSASPLDCQQIFNGTEVGLKTSTLGGVNVQGESFWNSTTKKVYIYSTSNPATFYSSVYLAQEQDIIYIENNNNLLIEDIDVRYGGKHGIQGATTNGIIIRNITMSYIGGTYQSGTLKYGNGIQFWNTAQNNLVERSTISYVYDAPISNQGSSGNQNNITYRYNIITNSQYGIELWLTGGGCLTNITSDHNTIYNMGTEKYTRGSPYPMGFRYSESNVCGYGINVTNNINFNSTYLAVELGAGSSLKWNASILFDYNIYSKGTGTNLINWKGSSYSNLATFVSARHNESHGLESSPLFLSTDPTSENFLVPASDSPACTMSSTGSYVGALPCAEDVVPPSFGSPVLNNTSPYYNDIVQINMTAFSSDNISAVWFMVQNNSDSVWRNQTLVILSGNTNASISFNYTIVDFTILGGTQYYQFLANTGSGASDVSSVFSFVVQNVEQFAPNITAPSNLTVEYGNISWESYFTFDDDVAIDSAWVNNSNFDITNSGTLTQLNILPVGLYWLNITVNDTSNNRTSLTNWYVNITKSLDPCNLYFTETSPLEYPGTFRVYTYCTSAYNLSRNGTAVTNYSLQSLAVGTYPFELNRTDRINYTNYYDSESFVITTPESSTEASRTVNDYIVAISIIAAFYSIFVIIIISSIIINVVNNKPINWNGVILSASALLLNAVFSVLMMYILINLY